MSVMIEHIHTEPLDKIHIEPTIHPRMRIDWRTSYTYYQAMKTGERFPPLVVAQLEGKYVLVDGVHRYKALQMLKATEVPVEVIKCKNLDACYIQAIRLNTTHGKPLDMYEKAEITRRLKDKMSVKQISKLLHITPKALNKLIIERIKPTDDGEVTVKAPLKHLEGARGVSRETQTGFTGASQLSLINQLRQIIECGWLDTENKEVVKALTTLKALLIRVIA